MTGQVGASTDALDRAVRLSVFRQTAETARVLKPDEIAVALGRAEPEVEESLRRLAASRVLVLAPGTANVWLAPPVCAVPSDFRVLVEGRTYWGSCVWDALGIPVALHADATVTARRGESDEEMVLEVRNGALARGEGIVHFAVPAIRWWENIAFA